MRFTKFSEINAKLDEKEDHQEDEDGNKDTEEHVYGRYERTSVSNRCYIFLTGQFGKKEKRQLTKTCPKKL